MRPWTGRLRMSKQRSEEELLTPSGLVSLGLAKELSKGFLVLTKRLSGGNSAGDRNYPPGTGSERLVRSATTCSALKVLTRFSKERSLWKALELVPEWKRY